MVQCHSFIIKSFKRKQITWYKRVSVDRKMICHTVQTLARPKVDDWDQSSPDVFRILGQPVDTRLSWYGSMVQLCSYAQRFSRSHPCPKAAQKAARGCHDRESDHDSDRHHHRPRAVKNFDVISVISIGS